MSFYRYCSFGPFNLLKIEFFPYNWPEKLFWWTKSIQICFNSRSSTEITFRNVKLDETLLFSSKRRSNKNSIRDWVLLRPFHGFNLVLVKAPGNANFLPSDNIRPKAESIGYIVRCTFENYFKPCIISRSTQFLACQKEGLYTPHKP